jgi:protein phosphatase
LTQADAQTLFHTFSFNSFASTHQGNVRNLNEDSILSMPESCLWAVADGMGGHSAGDVASQQLIKELEVLPNQSTLSEMVNAVDDALLKANFELRTYSRNNLNGLTIGSTVVCLVLKEKIGAVLWVGDSRLYRYRKGVLEQLTRDHSEVQARIDSGILSAEQAEKSTMKNILSRAVGAFDELAIDVNAFTIHADDLFLLCSDGLYNELSTRELQKTLHSSSFEKLSGDLMRACLSRKAKDNISLIVVKAVQ